MKRRLDYFQDVTVFAGEEKKKFVVHRNIVCQTSDYFQAACNGKWKEAKEKVVNLPTIKSHVFGIYVCWLYTSKVDIKDDPDLMYDESMTARQRSWLQMDLLDAYAAGDYLQDRTLRNAVIDEFRSLIEGTDEVLDQENVIYFWDIVRQDSKLSGLIVDYYSADYNPDLFDLRVAHFPVGLTVAIAKKYVRDKQTDFSSRKPRNKPKCYYHEHGTDPAKESCE